MAWFRALWCSGKLASDLTNFVGWLQGKGARMAQTSDHQSGSFGALRSSRLCQKVIFVQSKWQSWQAGILKIFNGRTRNNKLLTGVLNSSQVPVKQHFSMQFLQLEWPTASQSNVQLEIRRIAAATAACQIDPMKLTITVWAVTLNGPDALTILTMVSVSVDPLWMRKIID